MDRPATPPSGGQAGLKNVLFALVLCLHGSLYCLFQLRTPDPFMDELFHVPQAEAMRTFFSAAWEHAWDRELDVGGGPGTGAAPPSWYAYDPKITTPPGPYYLALAGPVPLLEKLEFRRSLAELRGNLRREGGEWAVQESGDATDVERTAVWRAVNALFVGPANFWLIQRILWLTHDSTPPGSSDGSLVGVLGML